MRQDERSIFRRPVTLRRTVLAAGLALLVGGGESRAAPIPLDDAPAIGIADYMLISFGRPSTVGNALALSDSELGAIGFNPKTSPPSGNPALPPGSRGPSTGITLDGDVAIVQTDGTVTLSNSRIHALNSGPGSPGAQGIDCAGGFNRCTDSGSQISSNNEFNTQAPAPSYVPLGNGDGVQGMVSLADVISQALGSSVSIADLPATQTFNITTDINSNRLDSFLPGLNVVDIRTGGNDLRLNTATWTVSGDEDTYVIFRVERGAVLSSQNGNFALGGTIGNNNVLFAVDADEGEVAFAFDNTTFQGYSYWDIARPGGIREDGTTRRNNRGRNEAKFNNVQGCGQVATDKISFQNVSMTNCSFGIPTEVPSPAALGLFGVALAGLGLVRRRRRG